jgi:hypothetical protein
MSHTEWLVPGKKHKKVFLTHTLAGENWSNNKPTNNQLKNKPNNQLQTNAKQKPNTD